MRTMIIPSALSLAALPIALLATWSCGDEDGGSGCGDDCAAAAGSAGAAGSSGTEGGGGDAGSGDAGSSAEGSSGADSGGSGAEATGGAAGQVDTGGAGGQGPAVGCLDHIKIEIVIGQYGTANRRDTDCFSPQIHFVQALGHKPMGYGVAAARAVMGGVWL